jgi:hypothetical protein
MASAWKYAATVAFTVIVIITGYLHGKQTARWEKKPPLDEYVSRINDIPRSFGDWDSEQRDFQDDLSHHGIEGYIYRVYSNRRTTEKYEVLVVCGRPGPIGAHTPDVCYRSAGYTPYGDVKRGDITLADKAKVIPLFQMKFKPPKTSLNDLDLEIRWAWMAPGKQLLAPDFPRVQFASEPALYKVYVLDKRAPTPAAQSPTMTGVPATNLTAGPSHDPQKFLQEFLPLLEHKLRGPPADPARTS